MWYVVCLAALTAMFRARGMMFSKIARTGLEPAVVETRAVDLLLVAFNDFAACQGGVSSFSDLGQAHPFVLARPILVRFLGCFIAAPVLACLPS